MREDSVDLSFITLLAGVLQQRLKHETATSSYTVRLLQAGLAKILDKLGEECVELAVAVKIAADAEVIYEAADSYYHLLVLVTFFELEISEILPSNELVTAEWHKAKVAEEADGILLAAFANLAYTLTAATEFAKQPENNSRQELVTQLTSMFVSISLLYMQRGIAANSVMQEMEGRMSSSAPPRQA